MLHAGLILIIVILWLRVRRLEKYNTRVVSKFFKQIEQSQQSQTPVETLT